MEKNYLPPKGLNWMTPMISVEDANAAIDFYVEVFGFQAHEIMNDKKSNVIFARLIYHDINLMISAHNMIAEEGEIKSPKITQCPPQVSFYVYCGDIEKRYQKAKEYGLQFLQERTVQFWGDKTFRVVDPNGYIWSFATPVTEHHAEKLPVEVM